MTYPVFINLSGMEIVIVGGGRIAGRKLKQLTGQGANIRVIAPRINEDVQAMAEHDENVYIIEEKFKPEHLEEASMVFIASSHEGANQAAQAYCIQNRILFNNMTNAEQSSLKSGALVKKGSVEIAIGTGGKRPGVSKWLSEKVKACIPDNIDEITAYYDSLRAYAQAAYSDSAQREQYIKEAFKTYLDQMQSESS